MTENVEQNMGENSGEIQHLVQKSNDLAALLSGPEKNPPPPVGVQLPPPPVVVQPPLEPVQLSNTTPKRKVGLFRRSRNRPPKSFRTTPLPRIPTVNLVPPQAVHAPPRFTHPHPVLVFPPYPNFHHVTPISFPHPPPPMPPLAPPPPPSTPPPTPTSSSPMNAFPPVPTQSGSVTLPPPTPSVKQYYFF